MRIHPETRALISLHDVMPESLPVVSDLLQRIETWGIPPITLLVVPGKPWQPEQIELLRKWSDKGHILAAHGWIHEARNIRRIYHRLHSWIISRNVAEHLEWEPDTIVPKIQRSAAWFAENNLPVPNFYVPPAWALGQIRFPLQSQNNLPVPDFPTHVEVLRGIIDTRTGRLMQLPLVGFEADTPFRAGFVRWWNRIQLALARRSGKPVRIGLHPNDFNLRLAQDAESILSSPNLTPVDIRSWLRLG